MNDSFESIMGKLGLFERKPIAEPVAFEEPDPLGINVLNAAYCNHDLGSVG